MTNNTQAFKQYLKNREAAIKIEQLQNSKSSGLFNEKTFYHSFTKDLLEAKKEVIIYSPFVSKFRADFYKPIIEKLRNRNIEVFIFTRPLDEYELIFRPQIKQALKNLEKQGICIFFMGKYIHQKVAIIDRAILWEGSLNILSHRASNEMMRRTSDENLAMGVVVHLGLNIKLAESYKQIYEKMYRSLNGTIIYERKAKIKLFVFGLSISLILWWLSSFIKAVLPILKLLANW